MSDQPAPELSKVTEKILDLVGKGYEILFLPHPLGTDETNTLVVSLRRTTASGEPLQHSTLLRRNDHFDAELYRVLCVSEIEMNKVAMAWGT